MSQPRRFYLKRNADASGVSGVGKVAEGTRYSNGKVSMTWLTHLSSDTWFSSIDVLEEIHSHGGKTIVVWIDPPSSNEVEEYVPEAPKAP